MLGVLCTTDLPPGRAFFGVGHGQAPEITGPLLALTGFAFPHKEKNTKDPRETEGTQNYVVFTEFGKE